MEKNQYEEAKRTFVISLIVLIAIVLLLLIPIHITYEDSDSLVGIHISFFLIGLAPQVISLFGYFLLIEKEKEITMANIIGILSTSLTIIFWVIFLLGFYRKIPFGPSSGIIVVFGIIAFSIWFGMLFDRNRYVSDKIKKFKRERVNTYNDVNVQDEVII